MKRYLVLNGPKPQSTRQTRARYLWGSHSRKNRKYTEGFLSEHDLEIEWFQSNHEGELVEKIQEFQNGNFDALILNPAGYSHTSVAIYDALKSVRKPVIETHLTNVHAREEFRQTLLTAKAASTIMCGLGKRAYAMAILSHYLDDTKDQK